MSGPEEKRRITCPRCGRLAPAMTYCIYCGARLPKVMPPPQVTVRPTPQIPTVPPPATVPRRAPEPPRPTPPPTVKISPPPPAPAQVDSEILKLMSDITRYHERRISVLDMFSSGEVSGRVFKKLYDEYANKVKELLDFHARKLDELKTEYEGKGKRLDDIKMGIEELEVRHKIGEVDDQKFNERINMLRTEETRLQNALKQLKMNIDHLGRIFAGKSPREILDLDAKTRSFSDALGKLVEEGKISNEALDMIKPDIEKTLGFFDSLIGERKEKERTLREQLETLQARYRVSEISIEEYETKKRELQQEIDKIWT
ncbi:MAG: hypothetical protein OEZ48_15435 [Candidatus Bathyarchaeota archaeon]|nr:hypothetical protein [Candidatus Bathyarchaeota archaeon]MDH5689241.1 hypothetical protein [Candidatus Bathyarchaeota archaeon]